MLCCEFGGRGGSGVCENGGGLGMEARALIYVAVFSSVISR